VFISMFWCVGLVLEEYCIFKLCLYLLLYIILLSPTISCSFLLPSLILVFRFISWVFRVLVGCLSRCVGKYGGFIRMIE
jgi:hypothetical protein